MLGKSFNAFVHYSDRWESDVFTKEISDSINLKVLSMKFNLKKRQTQMKYLTQIGRRLYSNGN